MTPEESPVGGVPESLPITVPDQTFSPDAPVARECPPACGCAGQCPCVNTR